MTTDLAQAPVKADFYAMFCGPIEQGNMGKFVNFIALATRSNINMLHLLFQSAGGFVGDGVFLHSIFKALPIPMTIYNSGQVSSAGVTAFLGAKRRVVTAHGVFMIHRSHSSPTVPMGAAHLQGVADSLVIDDARTDAILREHLVMPDDKWAKINHFGLFVSGPEAVECKFADSLGDFSPPEGTQIYNVLA